MSQIADLRQEYKKNQLSEDQILPDPIDQFKLWFQEALNASILEPNAFALATVGENGTPSARILLLKGFNDQGFDFYTNYESDKSRDLIDFPVASMVFLWLELERQVRISGPVVKVSRAESEAYFHSRPRESQIGAWVSPQSRVISSRNVLEKSLQEMTDKYSEFSVIPLPDHWGGFRLQPVEIEFWQGRPNRLHDRLLYSATEAETWKIERLAP